MSDHEDTVLRVEGLSKRFVLHERGKVIEAFRDLSLTVSVGQIVVFVGASGSGKSSVLKCLYRTYLPSSGKVLYCTDGGETVDLASAREQDVLQLRRREIRLVSQFLHVLPRQTAVDVVGRPLLELGGDAAESREAAREMLVRVGLPDHLWEVPPHTFSGGERQLVNLARALVVQPRLLLLDEPAASLDPTSRVQVVDSIERLKHEGMAVIGVFHDREIITRLADKTVQMHGGVTWNH